MYTANNTNNDTIKSLVAKYRNFVKNSIADWQWELAKRVKFCYDRDNDYILIDGQVLLLHNRSIEQILDYFNTIFPGCELDNEFTNGLTRFYMGDSSNPINEYMANLITRCRADYQILSGLYRIVSHESCNVQIMNIMSIYAEKFTKNALEANALEAEELNFLCQNFSDFVSYEFEDENQWFCTIEEERFYAPEVSKLSREVIDFLTKYMLTVDTPRTVFAFNAGRGEIARCFPQITIKGNGYHGIDWALGQIYLYAITGNYSEIVPQEELIIPSKESVDLVTFDALDYINGIGDTEIDLNLLFDSLKHGGRMIIFASRFGVICPEEKSAKKAGSLSLCGLSMKRQSNQLFLLKKIFTAQETYYPEIRMIFYSLLRKKAIQQ